MLLLDSLFSQTQGDARGGCPGEMHRWYQGMPKVNLKTHFKKSCSRSVFTVTCFQLGVGKIGFFCDIFFISPAIWIEYQIVLKIGRFTTFGIKYNFLLVPCPLDEILTNYLVFSHSARPVKNIRFSKMYLLFSKYLDFASHGRIYSLSSWVGNRPRQKNPR
jgi:hypothetical protein